MFKIFKTEFSTKSLYLKVVPVPVNFGKYGSVETQLSFVRLSSCFVRLRCQDNLRATLCWCSYSALSFHLLLKAVNWAEV